MAASAKGSEVIPAWDIIGLRALFVMISKLGRCGRLF